MHIQQQQFTTTSLERAYNAGRTSEVLLLKFSGNHLLDESFGKQLGQEYEQR